MDEVSTLQMRYGLSALLAKILHLMVHHQALTPTMIESEYALTNDAPVAVHRLRRRMTAHDVTIHFRRGVGYWLEMPDRMKVTKAMVPDQMSLPLGDRGEGGAEATS